MARHISEHRVAWLAVGVLAGMCISYFWPHEPARAAATDRSGKFALVTVPVTPNIAAAGVSTPETEGVFVLDFLTGRLIGGVINPRNGQFTHSYARNVFLDFQVNPELGEPTYAIVAGRMPLTVRGAQLASGVIYVAELSSGRVQAYSFPYVENRPIAGGQLVPLSTFPFREAVQPQ